MEEFEQVALENYEFENRGLYLFAFFLASSARQNPDAEENDDSIIHSDHSSKKLSTDTLTK